MAGHRKLGPVLATDRRRRQHDRLGHLPAAGHARRRRQRHRHRLGERPPSARSRWRCCSASSRDASRWRAAPRPTSSMRSARSAGMQASLWYWTSCLIGNVAIAAAASGYLAAFFGIAAGPALLACHHHRADVAGNRGQPGESAVRGPVQWTAADRRPGAAAAGRSPSAGSCSTPRSSAPTGM